LGPGRNPGGRERKAGGDGKKKPQTERGKTGEGNRGRMSFRVQCRTKEAQKPGGGEKRKEHRGKN